MASSSSARNPTMHLHQVGLSLFTYILDTIFHEEPIHSEVWGSWGHHSFHASEQIVRPLRVQLWGKATIGSLLNFIIDDDSTRITVNARRTRVKVFWQRA